MHPPGEGTACGSSASATSHTTSGSSGIAERAPPFRYSARKPGYYVTAYTACTKCPRCPKCSAQATAIFGYATPGCCCRLAVLAPWGCDGLELLSSASTCQCLCLSAAAYQHQCSYTKSNNLYDSWPRLRP